MPLRDAENRGGSSLADRLVRQGTRLTAVRETFPAHSESARGHS